MRIFYYVLFLVFVFTLMSQDVHSINEYMDEYEEDHPPDPADMEDFEDSETIGWLDVKVWTWLSLNKHDLLIFVDF